MKSFHLALGLTSALMVLLAGCASTGIPLPPSLELPKPVANLRAVRKGSKVYLAWTVPTETTDRQTIRHPGPTLICRSLQPAITACDAPAGEVAAGLSAVKPPQSKGSQGVQAVYIDTLPEVLQRDPAASITYAVQALNANHRAGALSNQVQVSSAVTLPPPEGFSADLTKDGVLLTWKTLPPQPENQPVRHVYRVYRQQEGGTSDTIVGEVPLSNSEQGQIQDHSFDWEKTYRYRATVVTVVQAQGHPEAQVEGEDTPSVQVSTHDVFPPAVPSGLQAVFSGVGQQPFIDLIWSPITDSDLAGYNMYRHEEGSPPSKINSEPIKAPAFRDPNVQSGRTYFYTVTSVDVRGNESAPSEETSEQVP